MLLQRRKMARRQQFQFPAQSTAIAPLPGRQAPAPWTPQTTPPSPPRARPDRWAHRGSPFLLAARLRWVATIGSAGPVGSAIRIDGASSCPRTPSTEGTRGTQEPTTRSKRRCATSIKGRRVDRAVRDTRPSRRARWTRTPTCIRTCTASPSTATEERGQALSALHRNTTSRRRARAAILPTRPSHRPLDMGRE